MTPSTETQTDDERTEAEHYLATLAGYTDGMTGEYEFEGIEVPDSIAGKLRDDPRVNITTVEKGEFGLDQGTMIISFTIQPETNADTVKSTDK